jgi:hypothetical protein
MTNDTTQREDDAAAEAPNGAGAAPRRDMSPASAVGRHLEWLEHALAVAREEETRRQGRLDRAKDKNRDKRTARLAEVADEVAELEALVAGIKDLQARAGAIGGGDALRPRTTPAPQA